MTEEGFWLSLSDLAAERGIDKATVSRRVRKFVDADLVEVRRGPGGTKLVNVAAFDKASAESLDGLAVMAGGSSSRSTDPVLAHEQARRMAYMADLAQLDLDERLGKLLPLSGVVEAIDEAVRVLVAGLETLPNHAAELAAVVAQEGSAGLRTALRTTVFQLRTRLADDFAKVADAAELEHRNRPNQREETEQ